jgi:hypothetical protein
MSNLQIYCDICHSFIWQTTKPIDELFCATDSIEILSIHVLHAYTVTYVAKPFPAIETPKNTMKPLDLYYYGSLFVKHIYIL